MRKIGSKQYDDLIKEDNIDQVFGIYDAKDNQDIQEELNFQFKNIYKSSGIKSDKDLIYSTLSIDSSDGETPKKRQIAKYEDNKKYYTNYFTIYFNNHTLATKFKTFKSIKNNYELFEKCLSRIFSSKLPGPS